MKEISSDELIHLHKLAECLESADLYCQSYIRSGGTQNSKVYKFFYNAQNIISGIRSNINQIKGELK